jgi:GT2 family glycosyltransferase
MTRVAVSILNHNSATSTIACVRSVLAAAKVAGNDCRLDVFVADNASGNQEGLQLQRSLDGVANTHLHINSKNLGFAAGHNRNLHTIFSQSNPDYIWLLNNDCLVEETALSSLVECAHQNEKIGIWGATLLEPDGETIQCAGGCLYNSWLSSYRQTGRGKKLHQLTLLEPVSFDYVAGASLFLPVATLQEGLCPAPQLEGAESVNSKQWLNESFFLYFEELDLAKRLKPGVGMAWCKEAVIAHMGGASTGTSENQRSELAEYHSSLSALRFTRLYYPRRLWIVALARYLSKCLLLSVRGDIHLIGPMTRAYRVFWTGFGAES